MFAESAGVGSEPGGLLRGDIMEFRQLGSAGLRVPALSFGTATFGGGSETRPS